MILTNTKRIFVSGFRSFVRSGFTSFASILMMTITLFVITSLIFIQATLSSSLADIRDKVDVTVYFVQGADPSAVKDISTGIQKLPEVKTVTYTSATDALAEFKSHHADDYLSLQALDELGGVNPLGPALSIKAHDPSQYDSIVKYVNNNYVVSTGSKSIVDTVDYYKNKVVIDRLTSIISGAHRLGLAVSLVLVLISIMITFSTMRLIIYMSREEISVMRLVGAGGRYIGGPFLVTGMIVGIVAAILTILIFLPITIWLGNQMTDFIGINLFTYYKDNFFQLLALMLGSGIILGSISSAFAIIRYLRKK
jgi:cell division transport system permease protein